MLTASGRAVKSWRVLCSFLHCHSWCCATSSEPVCTHPERLPDAVGVHTTRHILHEVPHQVRRNVTGVLHHLCAGNKPMLQRCLHPLHLAKAPRQPHTTSELIAARAATHSVVSPVRTEAPEDVAPSVCQRLALLECDVRCKLVLLVAAHRWTEAITDPKPR
jgi:hypothetical protein